MRGRRILLRGGFGTLDATVLTAFHDGLQTQFGFTPVGTLISRSFGPDGAFAVALYEEALITIRRNADMLTIQATIESSAFGQLNFDALKVFIQTTFGMMSLQRETGIVALTVTEDEAEL